MTASQETNEVRNLVRTPLHEGFFTLAAHSFQQRQSSGEWSGTITREILERRQAVAVLPYDPVRDEVLLISQVLIGAHLADKPARQLQVIAGMVDDGESADQAALREAREEAGCEILRIVHLQDFLPTPGGSDEEVCVKLAEADLENAGGHFGLASEDEDIHANVMSASAAIDALDRGEIVAGPAVVALLQFARRRDQIRRDWLDDRGVLE